MRTLTQITAHLGHPPNEELEKLEAQDKHPRVLLFERSLNAKMMDEQHIARTSGLLHWVYQILPVNIAQAIETYRLRTYFDAVISWAENLGLPFAFLLWLTGAWASHIGIFSWISKPKKAFFFRFLHRQFDRIVLMSSKQRDFAVQELKIDPRKVILLRWPVDQRFWRPMPAPNAEQMICAVGREMRDYATLVEAIRPIGIRCHIAAGGITSGKRDQWQKVFSDPSTMPPFITVGRKSFLELRDLYACSQFVVIPLFPTDTDNGTTSILEAIAMGKAVICSKVEGQRDVVEHGVNGLFVPPGDIAALRSAIEYLLNNPGVAKEMGKAGRRLIERNHAFDGFVASVTAIVQEVINERVESSSHFSAPRDPIHPIRVISVVTKGSTRPERPELRRLEKQDLFPRTYIFEERINASTMDEHYLKRVPYYRRIFYKILPVPLWQAIECSMLRTRFDGVISWSARNVIIQGWWQKLTGRRLKHIALMSWFSKPKVTFFLKPILPYIDHIIVWSSVQYHHAVRTLGVSSSKVTLVSRRVDHQFWRPMPGPTDCICSVGQEMRDYPTLIRALNGLAIPCHIATGALRGELYDTVKELRRMSPLPANVTTGKLNYVELRKLYARSRFVVVPLLPTDTDNGVTVIEEAMAMGKAVICSQTKGQVDLIRDGENGLFVPQGDAEALRKAILHLWEHPDEADRLGRAGREFIVSRHTIDHFVESVREITLRVVQSKPSI